MKKLKMCFSLLLITALVFTLTSSFVSAAPNVIGSAKFKVEEKVFSNPWYMFKKKIQHLHHGIALNTKDLKI